MSKIQLELDELKQIELDILKKFDKICRDNNLEYSIAFGTMLGAVRHKGFIPWDDDIDVLMKREDYEKLLKLEYEDENFEIKSYRYSKHYFYPFSKMVDKRTQLYEDWRAEKDMGVYIDIFPLDYLSFNTAGKELEKDMQSTIRKAKKWDNIAHIMGHKLSHHKGFNIRYFTKLLLMLLTYPFKKTIIKHADLLNANGNNGNYCAMMLQINAKKPFTSASSYDEVVYVDFEDFKAPVYKGYDNILSDMYGDYMTPPPVEEQKSIHWFKAYKIAE